MKKCFIAFLAIAVVLAFSLSAMAAEPIKIPSTPQKVFEYNYTNNAWGYHNEGWYIDTAGSIVRYRTVSGTLETKVVGSISQTVLYQKYLLLVQASYGTLTKPVQVGADMGSLTHKGYIASSTTTSITPREVILQVKGDFEIYNTSPYAKALVTWMDSLNVPAF